MYVLFVSRLSMAHPLTMEQVMRITLCREDYTNMTDDLMGLLSGASQHDTYPSDTNTSAYFTNDTTSLYNNTAAPINSAEDDDENKIYQKIEDVLLSKVAFSICVFGVIGNILNIWILTHKGLQSSMGRMEKFAHTGLISLAVSDMMFCVLVLPLSHISVHDYYTTNPYDFKSLYNQYQNALINTFLLSSTMLTVTMAAGRYFAIVHPIRARQFIGMTCARRIISLVFVFCIVFNIPRFWKFQMTEIQCTTSGQRYYFRQDGAYKQFEVPYLATYFVIGILIPLILLAYCNIFLVKALHQSKKRITRFRQNDNQQETSQRITLTLVIIVIFYLLLLVPAELITVFREFADLIGFSISSDLFNMAVAIVNVLQSINFSFNFILYCIINTHFRNIVYNAVKCRCTAIKNYASNGRFDSDTGDSLGSSMRSTAQTSLRTVVYSSRLQNSTNNSDGNTVVNCTTQF